MIADNVNMLIANFEIKLGQKKQLFSFDVKRFNGQTSHHKIYKIGPE
jgi:hypothetical protein